MIELEKVVQLKARLDEYRPLNDDVEQRIISDIKLRWNYHSNAIEGNSLDYGETKALIYHNITAKGKPLKDHLEIKGHNDALNLILDVVHSERPITERFIRELHQIILGDEYRSPAISPSGEATTKIIKVGQYKSSQNHVKTSTGETFYFASPEETPAKMTDLIHWVQGLSYAIPEEVIANDVEFHYRFVLIHPFDDGNGRLARILMNFILMKGGFPPAIVQQENRQTYYEALRQADGDDLKPFTAFICESLTESLELMIAAAEGKSISEDSTRMKLDLLVREVQAKNEGPINHVERQISIVTNVLRRFSQLFEKESQPLKNLFSSLAVRLAYGNNLHDFKDFTALVDQIEGLLKEDLFAFSRYELSIAFYNYMGSDESFQLSQNYFLDFAQREYRFGPLGDNQITLPYKDLPSQQQLQELCNEVLESHMQKISEVEGL